MSLTALVVLFQVVIISTGMVTAVSSNPKFASRGKRELTKEEIQRQQQLQKDHEASVKKLVIANLQDGDVDTAVAEFVTLENKNGLAPEFVQSAYSSNKVQLIHLAMFTCKINFYATGYLAIKALYEEMAKKNQLEAQEMVLLYLRLKILADEADFKNQPPADQNNILSLKDTLAPHNMKIMTSLISNIKSEAFQSPKSILEVAKSIPNGEHLFLSDLVKLYFEKTSFSYFNRLYNFAKGLPYYSNICYSYAAMWKELKSRGSRESMEALAVWSHASEIAKMRLFSDDRCQDIANSEAPAYHRTLVSQYNSNIKFARTSNIREFHQQYKLSYFFADYIGSLSIHELQNDNFNRVVDAIEALPYSEDICFATYAVNERFKQSAMLGLFEHFQNLRAIHNVKTSSNYGTLDAIAKSKCESAYSYKPNAFIKLLNGQTSNCRLKNRYVDEPLYCTGDAYTEHGYRRVFTWIPNETDEDQYWSISVNNNPHGVRVHNLDHTSMDMRYIHGTVRGSPENLDKQTDYFRIDTIDGYVLLQPTSGKFKINNNK